MTWFFRLFAKYKSPEQLRRQTLEWALMSTKPGESSYDVLNRALAYLDYWVGLERADGVRDDAREHEAEPV